MFSVKLKRRTTAHWCTSTPQVCPIIGSDCKSAIQYCQTLSNTCGTYRGNCIERLLLTVSYASCIILSTLYSRAKAAKNIWRQCLTEVVGFDYILQYIVFSAVSHRRHFKYDAHVQKIIRWNTLYTGKKVP